MLQILTKWTTLFGEFEKKKKKKKKKPWDSDEIR
jgi:hypothetical protein